MTTPPLYSDLATDWLITPGLTPYPQALAHMEARARAIAANQAREKIWLLEHPPLYTAGASAKLGDLLQPQRFEVYESGRGGQYTYHGPGQRVVYVMLDLRRRGRDVSAFVRALEQWIIDSLADLDVGADRRSGRVGVWTQQAGGEDAKIAAIGVRLKKWVSFHGLAINVAPDLEHFSGIVPCGLSGYGVTSLSALGKQADMAALDQRLQSNFERLFGPIHTIEKVQNA